MYWCYVASQHVGERNQGFGQLITLNQMRITHLKQRRGTRAGAVTLLTAKLNRALRGASDKNRGFVGARLSSEYFVVD